MTNNLVQYATIFSAYGCMFNYNSETATLDLLDETIEGRVYNTAVEQAIADIAHFDDTANYLDGAAALALSHKIDGHPNPLAVSTRNRILEALHIMKDGKFVYQVLSLQKNNRSWHYSDLANDCNWFGDKCTHRGVNPDPNRKGRTSDRTPDQYHVRNTKGIINREQLVTPALNYVFNNIPEERLISGARYIDVDASIKKLKTLSLEERLKVIAELQEAV